MNDRQRSLTRRFLAYRFLMNLWFVEAVWLYFYRLFMSDAQVGILDASAFAIGLLAEVPSGALADRFGKSRMTKIGIFLAAIGMAGQAFGGFIPIFVSMSVMMIGFAFMSGADDALFYEKLKFPKESHEWRKFVSKSVQVAYIASIIAIPLGSFVFQISQELVFILNALGMALGLVALYGVHDKKAQRGNGHAVQESFREYGRGISQGFKAFSHKNLLLYVPIILTAQAVLYIYNWGLLKIVLLDRFDFSEEFGGVLLAVSCIAVVITLQLMNKYADKVHEKRLFTVLLLITAGMMTAAVPVAGIVGVIVIVTLQVADGIIFPFISEVLNRHATDSNRATVLSVASFLKSLPYIIVAPLIGWLNMIGRLDIFLIVSAALVIASLIFYLIRKRRDTVIDVVYE